MAAKKSSTTPSGKAGTHITSCSCKSDYQDGKYGKGRRVHSLNKAGNGATYTVCGSEKKL